MPAPGSHPRSAQANSCSAERGVCDFPVLMRSIETISKAPKLLGLTHLLPPDVDVGGELSNGRA